MLDLAHLAPEVAGGAMAYGLHAASHRLYHAVGGGLRRALSRAYRASQ
jgi:hypothetical protein